MPVPPIIPAVGIPVAYPVGAAIPVNICKQPQEGTKCVPLSFSFSTTTSWSVDFSQGTPNPILSQVAALYIDNSNGTHDILILFPDTGFQILCPFGQQKLAPVLTAQNNLKFNVVLATNGVTNSIDMCNIFALNQYVPEFSSTSQNNVFEYGVGFLFGPQAFFAQSDTFPTVKFFQTGASAGYTLINHPLWYITGLNVKVTGLMTDGTEGVYELTLGEGTIPFRPIRQYVFSLNAAYQNIILEDSKGMNLQSNTGKVFRAFLTKIVGTDAAAIHLTYNIDGGILTQ